MSRKISDDELIHMYAKPGRGYTDAGLGEYFGVGREAIYKRRRNLERKYPFKQTERGRWRIDAEKLISHIAVSQNEALVLYLATRRFGRNTPLARRYVKEALDKLAPKLHQPMTEKLVQAGARVPDHPNENKREQILNELMQAWSEKSAVRIKYQSLTREGEGIWHEVSPYLIEPSPWSDSVYLVGYSAKTKTIIPFSLERIEKAMLTGAPFKECDPATEEKLLEYAWGIWRSDQKAEKVQLRFTGRTAVRRLRESIWHPKQEIDGPDDYSYAVWEAPIAEWREMVPWIRGWGADVEVIEPEGLREKLKYEARRLAEKYGWTVHSSNSPPNDLLLPLNSPTRYLWAKTDRYNHQYYDTHPLICHLIDVAQVIGALWDCALPAATRRFFADTLKTDELTARRWLAFLAGLHDIGKATVVFQSSCQEKYRQRVLTILQEKGFDFPRISANPHWHGDLSTVILTELLQTQLNWDKRSARKVAAAVGGHHGAWPSNSTFLSAKQSTDQLGQGLWIEARSTLFVTLAKVLGIEDFTAINLPQDKTILNTFCILLAGLTSFTDWLGSMDKDYFRFVASDENLADYADRSYAQAKKVLQELGWTNWTPHTNITTFSNLVKRENPRPLQQAIISMVERQQPAPPALVIIETPMGEGKTEAAWYQADCWLTLHQQQGIYVAMPTQATGNEMHKRVSRFLKWRYPEQDITPLLLHGDALWNEEMHKLRFGEIGDNGKRTVGAYAWFLSNKKRSLLSPFAVGTIDQALMAAMQTQHFFVRLFGLSHKTVIFDEVHAYDTYMNELFQRLLNWLAALDTSVILLSATLPNKTRRQLIEAYTGQPFDKAVTYPAITWATPAMGSDVIQIESSARSDTHINWLESDELIEYLRSAMRDGGYVAIICNTVDRVQTLYQTLKDEHLVPTEDDLIVFHARFPFYQRRNIEETVVKRFGETRPANQSDRAIIIATQVIEQSLDLDFDLMLTDPAPIDFILQRLGRLHRHKRLRPAPLSEPTLTIFKPSLVNGLPYFGNDEQIYSRYILLRSYLAVDMAMQTGAKIAIPGQMQELIEQVYGDMLDEGNLPSDWQEALQQAKEKQEITEKKLKAEALKRLISDPTRDRLMTESSYELEDEDEEVQQYLHYFTRATRPNVTLVCLHQMGNEVFLDPDGKNMVELNTEPDRETARHLAECKVTISNFAVVKHFRAQKPHPAWQDHAILRHYYPLCFIDNRYSINEKLSLIFDKKQGIIIQKEAT